jgi:hypothetical protein
MVTSSVPVSESEPALADVEVGAEVAGPCVELELVRSVHPIERSGMSSKPYAFERVIDQL